MPFPIIYTLWRFISKILVVKVVIKLRSRRKTSKTGDFGDPILRRGDAPNFGHAFSNRSHFRTCGPFWL